MIIKTIDDNNNVIIKTQALLPPGDAGIIKIVIVKGENHPEDSTVNFELSCATWVLPYVNAMTLCDELRFQLNTTLSENI